MKRGWIVLFLLAVVAVALPTRSSAQVAAYGEFSTVRMSNLDKTDYMYGATTGLLIDGAKLGRFVLSADFQGRFVGGDGKSMNGINIGPRFSLPMHRHHLTPYAELMVGFARFSDTNVTATTDSTFQINGGVAREISPRLDAVLDYSYSQFYYGGGQYNPKTFSAGLVYHLKRR